MLRWLRRAGHRFAREWLLTIFLPLNECRSRNSSGSSFTVQTKLVHGGFDHEDAGCIQRLLRIRQSGAPQRLSLRCSVSSWLAGTAALALGNLHDKELVARVLETLPARRNEIVEPGGSG